MIVVSVTPVTIPLLFFVIFSNIISIFLYSLIISSGIVVVLILLNVDCVSVIFELVKITTRF